MPLSIIAKLKPALRPQPEARPQQPARDPEGFVYVKIPESIMPIDRGSKYEDPLDERLVKAQLGTVTGGGSQLGDPLPDGKRYVVFCGIDIDVADLTKVLPFLRTELPTLGAPVGTELHYTQGGVRLQDEYQSDGWRLAQPRTFLHPGFGI